MGAAGRGRRRPPLSLSTIGLVAIGGAVGGLGRAAVGRWLPAGEGAIPLPTLLGNLSGAFLLALLLTLLGGGMLRAGWIRPLVAVGLLGAFTTFATLTYELQLLWAAGRAVTAVVYAVSTVAGGLAAVALGTAGAHAWLQRAARG